MNKPDSDIHDKPLLTQVSSLTKFYVDGLSKSPEAVSEHEYILSAILDSMGAALVVFDKEDKVILTNRATTDMTGRDLKHSSWHELWQVYKFYWDEGQTPILAEESPHEIAIQQKRTASAEGVAMGPGLPPEGIWISDVESPIIGQNGEFLGIVSIIQNITSRKRLERQRNALATLLTHDTKNHLAAWDILFEFFRIDLSKADRTQLEILDSLRQGNKQYLDLTNTLLELYRADFNVLESCRTQVDLDEILRSAVKLNSSYAAASDVRLDLNTVGELPSIPGIPSAIRQGLHNLIQNSIEVSPKGSTVEISAFTANSRVTIKVCDHGRGMSPEQAQKIFAPARVARSLPNAARSTGFGLYLTRLLIESHNGTISCVSELGKGTTFIIDLPTQLPSVLPT